jgi:hypothetical protein
LSKFVDARAVISSALRDLDEMEALIDLWERSHEDTMTDRCVIISVDTIAFHPMVTISDHGSVDSLKDLTHLDNPDLLTQFLADPAAFSAVLREYWHSSYTVLFAFQIQALHPNRTCCVVHVMPAVSGKGDNETVEGLHAAKSMLAGGFGFLVRGSTLTGIVVSTHFTQNSTMCGPCPWSQIHYPSLYHRVKI